MSTPHTPFLVGAYAAMPAEQADQEAFYTALSETGWVTGIEIPYHRDGLGVDLNWLRAQLEGRFFDNVITSIPHNMQHKDALPYGLASPDEEGRSNAVDGLKRLVDDVEKLNATQRLVSGLHLQSAPSDVAEAARLTESLNELEPLLADAGLTVHLEHCDARGHFAGEKRYLSLHEEIEVARELGMKITVNWGRSVLETRATAAPLAHVQELIAADLLGGVMFSGYSGIASSYGPAWGDAHHPLAEDEPISLMTADLVREVADAARDHWTYRGIKIQVPTDATVPQRVAIIGRVKKAIG